MGKTTAALTLLSLLGREFSDGERVSMLSPLERLCGFDPVPVLKRAVPIGIIDARPLPDHTPLGNWLTGPVQALARRLARDDIEVRSLSRAFTPTDLKGLLRAFVESVGASWSGRPPSAATTDQSYAVEVARREQLRAEVRERWAALVDAVVTRLAGGSPAAPTAPMLVVLVDDVDMSFRRTSDVLELMRLFAHPSLVFVVTGDSAQFRTALQVQLAADVAAPLESRPAQWASTMLEPWTASRIEQLSAAVLDKLIPKGHRFALRELDGRTWKQLVLSVAESEGVDRSEQDAQFKEIVDLLVDLPGALSSLSPRTVRNTVDLTLALVAVSRAATTRERFHKASSWVAAAGLGAPYRRDRDLVLHQDMERVLERAKLQRRTLGLPPTERVLVCSDEQLPPSGPDGLAANLILAIGSRPPGDIMNLPLDRAQLHWSPVWCVSSNRPGLFGLVGPDEPEAAPRAWGVPRLTTVDEFVRYWRSWQLILLAVQASTGSDRPRALAAAAFGAALCVDEGGAVSDDDVRDGAPVFKRFCDEVVAELVQPEPAREFARLYCAALVPSAGLPDDVVRSLVTHLKEAASRAQEDAETVRRKLRPWVPEAGSGDNEFTRWLRAPFESWDDAMTAIRVTGPVNVRGPDVTEVWPFNHELGTDRELSEFASEQAHLARLDDPLPEMLQLLTSVGEHREQQPLVLLDDQATSVDVELAASSERQLFSRRTSGDSWGAISAPWHFVGGTDVIEEQGDAVELRFLFASDEHPESPTVSGLRAPTPFLAVATALSLSHAARFVVARDVAQVWAGSEKLLPGVRGPHPMAAHNLKDGKREVLVPWYAPEFVTNSESVALARFMADVIGQLQSVAARSSSPFRTGALARSLLYAIPFVMRWDSIPPRPVDHRPDPDRLSHALRGLLGAVPAKVPSSRAVHEWARTELPLWAAPEYRLPSALAGRLVEELEKAEGLEIAWADVVSRRDLRVAELRARWSVGANQPQQETLSGMINSADDVGAWSSVQDLSGGTK